MPGCTESHFKTGGDGDGGRFRLGLRRADRLRQRLYSTQQYHLVNDDAPAGGDGASWATAYPHLQDALTAARDSGGAITEAQVAIAHRHRDAAHPTGTGGRAATFQLITGVAIRGGFAGNEDPATFNLPTAASRLTRPPQRRSGR